MVETKSSLVTTKSLLLVSFFFLTGFVPLASIIGPGVTVLTSGNIYKATAQFMIDQSIKKKTKGNVLNIFDCILQFQLVSES